MMYKLILVVIFFEYTRPDHFLPLIATLKIYLILPLIVLAYSVFSNGSVSNSDIFSAINSKLITFLLALLLLSVFISDVTLYSYNIFKTVLT